MLKFNNRSRNNVCENCLKVGIIISISSRCCKNSIGEQCNNNSKRKCLYSVVNEQLYVDGARYCCFVK